MKRKIIINCDPGHDDAIGIVVAVAHPAIDLLAITTVAGGKKGAVFPSNGMILRRIDHQNPSGR